MTLLFIAVSKGAIASNLQQTTQLQCESYTYGCEHVSIRICNIVNSSHPKMKATTDTPQAHTQSAIEKLPATTAVTNTQSYTTHPRQDLSSERRPSARERHVVWWARRTPVTRIHRSACCWIHSTRRPNSAHFGLISLTLTPFLYVRPFFIISPL
jgi:hypothetical protein